MKNKLFESYIRNASRFLTEDDEELEDVVDTEETEVPEEDEEGSEEEGEALELDLSNPVCPSCGATLIPVGAIDTEEEDEDGNPVYEEDEADAINLLQGLGYVVYKPTDDGEAVDDDFAGSDDEDFSDEEDLNDTEEEVEEEDEDF